MELIFLGTGPTKKLTQDGRTRSSLAVKTKNSTFIIGCSLDFSEQIMRENIADIDFILLTSADKDSTGGLVVQLRDWMNKRDLDKMPVYMEATTWHQIKKEIKAVSHIEPRLIKVNKSFSVFDNSFIPFRVSSGTQINTLGFKWDNVVYSEDVSEIPEESKQYYQNAHTAIFDAASWFGDKGNAHQNVADALKFATENKLNRFIMIQAGSSYPNHAEAQAKINQYWKQLGADDTEVMLAQDGLRLSTPQALTQILSEIKEGFCVSPPHGRMIYMSDKSLIVNSTLFRSKVGNLLYLIEDDLCYGLIRLHMPNKINLQEFKELEEQHQTTEDQRKKWWPNKEILYAYQFDVVEKYTHPRPIAVGDKTHTFITDFKFLEEKASKKLQQMSPHLLKELGDKLVVKDFISVIGGNNNSTDVNILIRLSSPSEFLKKAIEEQILKDCSFSKEINFKWGDPEVPHDTYIPLYDLQLVRKDLKIVTMQEEVLNLAAVTPFIPMKPKKLYEVDEVLACANKRKVAIEKKFKGTRLILIKTGSRIRLYSNEKDVTQYFPTIVSEASILSNKDMVLDGEVVKDGVDSATNSASTLHCFDISYLDGEELMEEPWYKRKATLHSLNFTPHIKEVTSLVTQFESEIKKAITFVNSLPGSDGAIIKDYDGRYYKGKQSDVWMDLVQGPTSTGTTGIPQVQGKKWKKKLLPGPKGGSL